jgi:hypothetical protein
MILNNIDVSKLSVEQKIVLYLAEIGVLTNNGDIQRALVDQAYAEFLITGNGLADDIPSCDDPDHEHCDHEPLSNDEIERVFTEDFN